MKVIKVTIGKNLTSKTYPKKVVRGSKNQ